LQLEKNFSCKSTKHFSCKSTKHFSCNSANASVATTKKLRLRLIATSQAIQLQLRKRFSCNHKKASVATNCKSTSTLVATLQCFSCNHKKKLWLRLIESTWYLQLRVHIDCNSNHYPIATEGVLQYQAEALSICNSEFTSIATRTTIHLQLRGSTLSGGST
jgi:hypothetical protein